jgi:spore coat polysaccharide biosynthesis predicted glycosyltransferase SpsG
MVFFADASPVIGSGHVMRLSALAEEAINRGIETIFVGRINDVKWLEVRILGLGFSKIIDVGSFISDPNQDILILDSYTYGISGQFIHEKNWKTIVSLADAQTPPYRVDLLVHPGLDVSTFHHKHENFIWGAKYIPLRASIKKRKFSLRQSVSEIVVFGGGTDNLGLAETIAGMLAKFSGFSKATFFSKSTHLIESMDPRFEALNFGPDLDHVIETADLVLTTASTSSLEVIAREIPVGIVCAADNQLSNYETLGNLGVAAKIGIYSESGEWELDSNIVNNLLIDFSCRSGLVIAASNLLDLRGSSRIVDAIIACSQKKDILGMENYEPE